MNLMKKHILRHTALPVMAAAVLTSPVSFAGVPEVEHTPKGLEMIKNQKATERAIFKKVRSEQKDRLKNPTDNNNILDEVALLSTELMNIRDHSQDYIDSDIENETDKKKRKWSESNTKYADKIKEHMLKIIEKYQKNEVAHRSQVGYGFPLKSDDPFVDQFIQIEEYIDQLCMDSDMSARVDGYNYLIDFVNSERFYPGS